MARIIALMVAFDLRTERRRATWWSWGNLAIFALTARLWMPRWIRWRLERIGRACLRRSVRLRHRRAVRQIACAHREMLDRSLPSVLRVGESVYRTMPAATKRAAAAPVPLPCGPRKVSE